MSAGQRERGALSRRAVLRGAGVALALPWLESLARPARAEVVVPPKRYIAIFFPCGAPEFWTPPTKGLGDNWQLGSVLAPLQPFKSKVTVVSGLENGSAFNADASSSVEPSEGRLTGGWLTCVDSVTVRQQLNVSEANGVSVDQVMAQSPAFAGKTALDSLQLGLTTEHSFCNGVPCSLSRSVSWKTQTTPLYKTIDPTTLFNQIVGLPAGPGNSSAAAQRDSRRSVLDAVQASAAAARKQLSAADKQRLDAFLTSVRGIEQNLPTSASCEPLLAKPDFPMLTGDGIRQNTATYDRSKHFDVMNRLLALALECDQTRIASYMLEDERSEFVFDFLPVRNFTAYDSTLGTGHCGEWHGFGQNGTQDDFASIVYWHVGKVAELCQLLDATKDFDGSTLLDNTVIFFGSALHGQDHSAHNLPVALIGGGGGRLKTNQHLAFNNRPLRDLHFTLTNGVYDAGVSDFGANLTGAPIQAIQELL